MGISPATSIVGYATWNGPVWAFAGNYQLCWCGADATTTGCKSPSATRQQVVEVVPLVEAWGADVCSI